MDIEKFFKNNIENISKKTKKIHIKNIISTLSLETKNSIKKLSQNFNDKNIYKIKEEHNKRKLEIEKILFLVEKKILEKNFDNCFFNLKKCEKILLEQKHISNLDNIYERISKLEKKLFLSIEDDFENELKKKKDKFKNLSNKLIKHIRDQDFKNILLIHKKIEIEIEKLSNSDFIMLSKKFNEISSILKFSKSVLEKNENKIFENKILKIEKLFKKIDFYLINKEDKKAIKIYEEIIEIFLKLKNRNLIKKIKIYKKIKSYYSKIEDISKTINIIKLSKEYQKNEIKKKILKE